MMKKSAFDFINFVQLENGRLKLDDVSPKLLIKGTEDGIFYFEV